MAAKASELDNDNFSGIDDNRDIDWLIYDYIKQEIEKMVTEANIDN
jgi:hypothetical protein